MPASYVIAGAKSGRGLRRHALFWGSGTITAVRATASPTCQCKRVIRTPNPGLSRDMPNCYVRPLQVRPPGR
jgi:hypothetical protein